MGKKKNPPEYVRQTSQVKVNVRRGEMSFLLRPAPHPILPPHLKTTPAMSNMSLAAVVSSLSWYLSDMKMTSLIPSKATAEEAR